MQQAPGSVQLNNPRVVRSWYMYDWANSVYSLVITTVIFPLYYKEVAVLNGSDVIPFLGFNIRNSVLYSYALSLSFLLVAVILPILSGAADYTGNKKVFMKFFVWLGSLSCMSLYFFDSFDTLWIGLSCSMLASVGYSASLVFYDAFLPEIVTPDRYDQTSARGFSMGYIGSVIMMIICLAIVMAYPSATRFSFVMVGLWWLGFSLIPFRFLPDNPYNRKPVGSIWSKGYEELGLVWRSLKGLPNLKRFLLAFFFYNMGVQTVMYLATLFGTDELHLGTETLIQTLVVIQLLGAVGAGLFSRLSKRKGNRFSLMFMIVVWIAVCISAYFIQTVGEFFALAAIVGLVMGGIQSLSRATYSKLIPKNTEDHASYFSFYDVTYNISIVFGTFSYGLIDQITGSMRNSALALGVYFVIGIAVLFTVTAKSVRNMREEEVEASTVSA